ncbi:MAG: HDOD domain-containing protein [Anaerolineae bacterium]|nr:HDOD domain-containing protein [Anaerolineae bacterium]
MPDKVRILFVDDEPRVLQDLRRTLNSMIEQWEMTFVESGVEALETLRLAEKPFEVIVTDMRMPGLDGTELLKMVKEQYPQMTRMILSGYGDSEVALRAVGLTHQYLSKPCDKETLISALAQTHALRDLLAADELKTLIAQMGSLPSLPTVQSALMRELHSPNASIKEVGRIIVQDIGMTTQILQLVNSAFFGLRWQISDPTQAVALLGLDTIKALLFSIQIFSQFDQTRLGINWFNSFQEHGFMVGTLARRIAEVEQAAKWLVDYAFIAGLLHDIGKLILAANLPEKYKVVLKRSTEEGDSLSQMEHELFGASHAEVGAYLLGLWGVPDPVVEALAFHHTPLKKLTREFSPLTAVYIANALAREIPPTGEIEQVAGVDAVYLAELGLTERWPLWLRCCQEVMG